jgi:hypothetical protein
VASPLPEIRGMSDEGATRGFPGGYEKHVVEFIYEMFDKKSKECSTAWLQSGQTNGAIG